jgi:hypothetical protein
MATFAVIENGIVENLIEADSLTVAQETTGLTCIEYNIGIDVSVGYLYDNGVFTNPNPPAPLIDQPLSAPVPVE